MIYFIADLHLNHKNILTYEPSRLALGNTVEEMNESIIGLFNETVSHDDVTIILGDIDFKQTTQNIERLNGKVVLFMGNHDRISRTKVMKCSNVIFYSKSPLQIGQYLLSHHPIGTDLVNIHGHIHSNTLPDGMTKDNHICVSIEVLDGFKPTSAIDLGVDEQPFYDFFVDKKL